MNKNLLILTLSTTLLVSACSHRCNWGNCSMKQSTGTATCSNRAPAYFAFDSSVLDQADKENLDRVAKRLKANPKEKIRISGYADSTGPNAYNMKLSERRAQSASHYLQLLGISADRISTRAYGATHFADSNKTEAGRAKNRRIEISYHL